MLLIDLVYNISLLITLMVIYQVVFSRKKRTKTSRQVLLGLMLGGAAVVGMLAPLEYGNGIIFDGRSVVLFVAALYGGPVAGSVAALLVGFYRVWLGGAGMAVGLATILLASGIGTVCYVYRRRYGDLNALQVFAAALVVHLLMLLLFLLLPNKAGFLIVGKIWLTVLLAYPLSTVIVCLLFQDYEEQELSRVNLRRLAYYDTLTGLPNRHFLAERIKPILSEAFESGRQGGLLLLHLDRFSRLNDARGYDVGDTLLRELALRLQQTLGQHGSLARMSGGDFFILLNETFAPGQALEQALHDWVARLRAALNLPVDVGDLKLPVFVSIGVTFFPRHAQDKPVHILERADVAMHRAKLKRGNQTVFYEQSMSVAAEQQFQVERELRMAIPDGQLRLYFQSQVASAGHIVGAETFVRWQHPEHGLMRPDMFIPVAEETDLIIELSEWVLTQICQLLAADKQNCIPGRVAVNISPRHFMHPDFLSSVISIFDSTGVDAARLKFEITENLWIHDMTDITQKMHMLIELGVHFSLDDFGTGYSSLTYIKHLSIHELKIDKSFVRDAPRTKDSAALVELILAVAQHMRLQVVAEGVETEEQARFLKARGHDILLQGFLYGRPEPFDAWVKRLAFKRLI